MKKVILAAGAVLIISLVILGCTSQERQQFKISSPPTPTTTSIPRPEATPSPVPSNSGYEELPSEPTDEELEAIIKRVEEEQGIEITGEIEGLDVPKNEPSTPVTTPEPTPTPAPTTKPETNGSYEPDKIPSDISGITPPAPDAGRDPTIDQASRDAWLNFGKETGAGSDLGERVGGEGSVGGSTMTPSEKAEYDQFLKDQGVTWDP